MSVRRLAYHSIATANNILGGAKATKSARTRHAREYIDFCLERGTPISDLRVATKESLLGFAEYLQKRNSLATTQNKLASIRALMSARNVDLRQLGIESNSSLGVGQRSRKGTKEPISDEEFEKSLEASLKQGKTGMFHALRLERYLGLRGLEAVMSTNALKRFAEEARSMVDGTFREVDIFDGTKGGRPRRTTVIFQHAHFTLEVIAGALAFANENQGYLISSDFGLKGARSLYHRTARKLGLVGKFAPHSLRYRYTVDKLTELHRLGVPAREAESLVAVWLGHGSGRGRWVRMVYGQSIAEKSPRVSRRKAQESVLASVRRLMDDL